MNQRISSVVSIWIMVWFGYYRGDHFNLLVLMMFIV